MQAVCQLATKCSTGWYGLNRDEPPSDDSENLEDYSQLGPRTARLAGCSSAITCRGMDRPPHACHSQPGREPTNQYSFPAHILVFPTLVTRNDGQDKILYRD